MMKKLDKIQSFSNEQFMTVRDTPLAIGHTLQNEDVNNYDTKDFSSSFISNSEKEIELNKNMLEEKNDEVSGSSF